MSVIEMDNTITRAIKYLHSGLPDSQYYLGLLLDESIKTSSYDVIPELSEMLNLPPVVYNLSLIQFLPFKTNLYKLLFFFSIMSIQLLTCHIMSLHMILHLKKIRNYVPILN